MIDSENIESEINLITKEKIYNTNYEIEAKYGIYKKNFSSTVNPIYFDKLRNHFNLTESKFSVVFSNGETRRIEENGSYQWQIKKRLKDFDIRDYNLRLSVNKETELNEYQIPDDFEPKSIRERTRWSHKFEETCELFMTIVKDRLKTSYDISYEIEIELYDMKKFNFFTKIIQEIYCILYDTNTIFKISEKDLLNEEIGDILNHKEHRDAKVKMENDNFRFGPFIYKSVLVEPRNIKKEDLSEEAFSTEYGPYTITYKADGVRRMLIVHSTGIWLVLPPYEYNLVLKLSDNKLIQKIFEGQTIVLDGELTKIDNDSKYNYFVFDCLAFGKNASKSIDIQNKTLIERLNCVQKYFIDNMYQLTNKNKSALILKEIEKIKKMISIEIKEYSILSKSKFKNQIKKFSENKPVYKTDGFIFTPVNSKYNHFSQLNQSNRSLLECPDVCKWKPPQDITIDFIIERDENENIELYYAKEFSDKGPELIKFTGNELYSDIKIDQTNELTKDLRNGTVVEYTWDYENKIMKPKCIRNDKQSANRKKVVMNNWNDIMDPITFSYLCDE